ncbi:HlyD family type I secretion periplasmic adaptor subunit [Minwuia sp.]|uniref:HlyD family type I secretion periplasmic adaptor subunit n=1 Tax=Minwuia sp. TaxID=2493630 RepID=UPI003A915C0F
MSMALGQIEPARGAAPEPGPLDRDPKLGIGRLTLIGGLIIAAFFLGLGGWATFVPLKSAAIAQGTVTVDGRRKTIQHLEGGIVREIPVKEGQVVEQGEVLIVLDDIRARSDVNLLRGRMGAALVTRARLAAERDGADGVAFPAEIDRMIPDEEERLSLLEGEMTVFEERRNFLDSQTSINRQRIAQLRSEITGLREEVVALNRQLDLIGEEERGLSSLVEKGLARKPQLLELQRQQANLNGDLARNKAAIARAQQQIGETELTILDVRTRFLNEVVGQLQQVQGEIADLRDRLSAADDVIRRTAVVSPVRGIVVNIQVNTTGGVISPGQPLLDIVPAAGGLTVEARVLPGDIDVVHAGLPAQVRISAFKIAENPILDGVVRTVSADALTDERTGESFYVARIELSDLSPLPEGAELQPGMAAEVMIVTGEQTPLQYLLEPIRISLRRAMRES